MSESHAKTELPPLRVKTAEAGKKHRPPLPQGLDSRNSSSAVTDVTGMSEVDYFKMQVRKMASAKKAAAADDDDDEVPSPTRNFPSRTVVASSTPMKPTLTAGTKSPTNAKGKKKGKKKATKIVATKPDALDEPKPRKPSPTPKEREIVNRIEKLAIIDLDVQREVDSMRKNVM